MKRFILVALWVLALSVSVRASPGYQGTKAVGDNISFPVICLDTIQGLQVNQPDSFTVLVWHEDVGDNAVTYDASGVTTVAWIAGIVVDAGDTTWYFRDAVADIDAGQGVGTYSGMVYAWTQTKRTPNSFSFKLVATPDAAGYPVVTVKDGTGQGEILTGGGGISLFGAGSITNTALAGNAATEIADSMLNQAVDAKIWGAKTFAGMFIGDSTNINTAAADSGWLLPAARELTALDEDNTTMDLDATTIGTVTAVTGLSADAIDAAAYADDAAYSLYGGAVWVDTTNGAAGVTVGTHGLPSAPVKGIPNAKTIADLIGVHRIYLIEGASLVTHTLAATMNGYEFHGIGSQNTVTIDLGSQDVGSSMFHNLEITGTQGGTLRAEFFQCAFESAAIYALARRCGLRGDITLQGKRDNVFENCYSSVPGELTPTVIFSGGSESVTFRHYSGGLHLLGMGANDSLSFEAIGGQLLIGAGVNVNANISARGMITIYDSTAGLNDLIYAATAQYAVDSFGLASNQTLIIDTANAALDTLQNQDDWVAKEASLYDPTTDSVIVDVSSASATDGLLAKTADSVWDGGLTRDLTTPNDYKATGFSTHTAANVRTQTDEALDSLYLDHLMKTAMGDTPVNSTLFAYLASKSATPAWASYVNTTDALEALRDRGDAAWITGGGGAGAKTLNLYAIDTSGTDTPVPWQNVSVSTLGGTFVGGGQMTDSDGLTSWNISASTSYLVTTVGTGYAWSTNDTITTDAGGAAFTDSVFGYDLTASNTTPGGQMTTLRDWAERNNVPLEGADVKITLSGSDMFYTSSDLVPAVTITIKTDTLGYWEVAIFGTDSLSAPGPGVATYNVEITHGDLDTPVKYTGLTIPANGSTTRLRAIVAAQ